MIIYLDTETTGVDDEDRLCQLAYKTDQGHFMSELFKPPLPIKFGAMATHHITEKMVAEKPSFWGSMAHFNLAQFLQNQDNIFVAHNAEFDIGMLKKEGIHVPRYICTLKIARALDPEGEAESHSLQYLRYFFGIEIDARAHDAWGDVSVLEQIFLLYWHKLQARYATPYEIFQEMFRISQNPVLIPRMPLGKYKGLHFRDVPKGYLRWMLSRDFDGDLMYTANYWLEH